VQSWSKHLRNAHPTFFFRSSTAFLPPPEDPKQAKGKQRVSESDAVGVEGLIEYLTVLAAERDKLVVAVVGLPNSGKSSVINSLLKSASLPIYKPSTMKEKASTTTLRPQPVVIEHNNISIILVDTPGYVVAVPETETGSSEEKSKWSQEEEVTRAKDMLLRVRGKIEKAKMPELAVSHIVERANVEDLMLFYNLPAFQAGDSTAFLTSHARSTGRLKKGGIPDLVESARSVLRDWRVGKFPYYTHPPASHSSSSPSTLSSSVAEIYERTDGPVLESIKTRKELRGGDGIVKLIPGTVDARPVVLVSLNADEEMDEVVAEEDDAEDVAEVDEDEGEAAESSASSEEEAEDDSDDEEVVIQVASTSKRKRTMSKSAPAPAPKKVAFASKKLGRTNSKPQGSESGPPFTQSDSDKKPKSSIKSAPAAAAAPKAKVKALEPARRVGNSKNSKGKTTSGGGNGGGATPGSEEAYDFKRFF